MKPPWAKLARVPKVSNKLGEGGIWYQGDFCRLVCLYKTQALLGTNGMGRDIRDAGA